MKPEILLVDDEPEILASLQRMLGKDFPVDTAASGPEGLRKIQAARNIGLHLDPSQNTSHSFRVFRDALLELASEA